MDAFGIGYKLPGVRRESQSVRFHAKHYHPTKRAGPLSEQQNSSGPPRRSLSHHALWHESPFEESKSEKHLGQSDKAAGKLDKILGGSRSRAMSLATSLPGQNVRRFSPPFQTEDLSSLHAPMEEELAMHLRTLSSKMDRCEAKIDGIAANFAAVQPGSLIHPQSECEVSNKAPPLNDDSKVTRFTTASTGSEMVVGAHGCSIDHEPQPEAVKTITGSTQGDESMCSGVPSSALKSKDQLASMEVKCSEQSKSSANVKPRIQWASTRSSDDGEHRRVSKISKFSGMLRKSFTGITLDSATSNSLFRHKYSARNRFLVTGKLAIQIKNFLEDSESSKAAGIYSIAMPVFITLSVVFTVLQSLEPPVISGVPAAVTEMVIDFSFMCEICARFVVSPHRWEFCTEPYNFIDLLTIIPMVVRILLWSFVSIRLPDDGGDLVLLARGFLLLVVPTLRLLKTLRRFEKFHLVVCAFEACFEALPILLWPLILITLVFSSLIYSVEPRDNIPSLPKAMWLTVVTMTTVGYGDVTPDNPIGSVVVGVLVISSVLYMAMPLGIIGHAFTEIWQERDRILLMKRTRERLLCWGYSPQDVPEVFSMFDRDGDGKLNYSEFHKMIRRMGVGLKEHRILALFEFFDEDATGEVDYEEFVNNLFPYRNLLDFLGEKSRTTRAGTTRCLSNVVSRSGSLSEIGPRDEDETKSTEQRHSTHSQDSDEWQSPQNSDGEVALRPEIHHALSQRSSSHKAPPILEEDETLVASRNGSKLGSVADADMLALLPGVSKDDSVIPQAATATTK